MADILSQGVVWLCYRIPTLSFEYASYLLIVYIVTVPSYIRTVLKQAQDSEQLKISLFNARSERTNEKTVAISDFIVDNAVDIVFVTETRLKTTPVFCFFLNVWLCYPIFTLPCNSAILFPACLMTLLSYIHTVLWLCDPIPRLSCGSAVLRPHVFWLCCPIFTQILCYSSIISKSCLVTLLFLVLSRIDYPAILSPHCLYMTLLSYLQSVLWLCYLLSTLCSCDSAILTPHCCDFAIPPARFFFLQLYCPSWIFPREIRVAFPGESQLRQDRATQPTVHAWWFSVSIIHRNLTWTTRSLTQMEMHAIAHGGLRTP